MQIPGRHGGNLLLEVLAKAPKNNHKIKDNLADLFARLLAGPADTGEARHGNISCDDLIDAGVRRMRSEILAALDDARFDAPDADEYRITLKLRCRARRPRGGARAERSRSAERDVEEDMPF